MPQRQRLGGGGLYPLVAVISISCLVATVSASMSGFYVDNGLDQTVMHRMLTPSDAQHVEHEILELLRLPNRPTGRKLRHPSMRKSAPKFLLDMYQRLSAEENGGIGHKRRSSRSASTDDNLITAIDRQAFEESDMIMTFLSKSEFAKVVLLAWIWAFESDRLRYVAIENHGEMRHERGRKLWFDVSEVAADSTLMLAELRIYQNPELAKWHSNDTTTVRDYAVDVYAIGAENADG